MIICTECVQVWTSDIYDKLHSVPASLDLISSHKRKNSRDDIVCSRQDKQSITRHSVRLYDITINWLISHTEPRRPPATRHVSTLLSYTVYPAQNETYTILKYMRERTLYNHKFSERSYGYREQHYIYDNLHRVRASLDLRYL